MGTEAHQPAKLGGSLKVPNVQELAKKPLSELPPRYAHPCQEPTATALVNSNADQEVPVINLERLLSGEFSDSELHKLHSACIDWGFFQVYFVEFGFAHCRLRYFSLLAAQTHSMLPSDSTSIELFESRWNHIRI